MLFHQGGVVFSFPENTDPGEGFQAGSTEERVGEGHQEDGEIFNSVVSGETTSPAS